MKAGTPNSSKNPAFLQVHFHRQDKMWLRNVSERYLGRKYSQQKQYQEVYNNLSIEHASRVCLVLIYLCLVHRYTLQNFEYWYSLKNLDQVSVSGKLKELLTTAKPIYNLMKFPAWRLSWRLPQNLSRTLPLVRTKSA